MQAQNAGARRRRERGGQPHGSRMQKLNVTEEAANEGAECRRSVSKRRRRTAARKQDAEARRRKGGGGYKLRIPKSSASKRRRRIAAR